MGLMKYCNRTGCNRFVPQGVKYCAAHTVGKTAENRQRHKEYDAHCRNQTAKDFYNSAEWKATRARALARDTNIDIYLYIMEGRIVTQPKTPNTTPFAITMPRSIPSVNVIKHIARKPAIVVIELPTTDVTVWEMACAIARFLSCG